MFATQWLTYLAGTGFTPAGIIDLARPHSVLWCFETLTSKPNYQIKPGSILRCVKLSLSYYHQIFVTAPFA
jgi:hypothetical protein